MNTCLHCNKQYEKKKSESYADFNKRKYCSTQCRNEHIKSEMIDCICDGCGNTYQKTKADLAKWKYGGFKQKFCSKACAQKARRTGETRICLQCGGSYYKAPYNLKVWGTKFCSKECRTAHREANPKSVKKACEGCGQLFDARVYGNRETRFCSKKCSSSQ